MKNALLSNPILVILGFFMTFEIVSCSKEKRLSEGKWQKTKLEERRSSMGSFTHEWVDISTPGCNWDDYYYFKGDHKLLIDDNHSPCSPNSSQWSEGTWSLTDNGKGIKLFGTTWDIDKLNGSTMILIVTDYITNNKQRLTMTHY